MTAVERPRGLAVAVDVTLPPPVALTRALRKLAKLREAERLGLDAARHRHYLSPGERRRLKARHAAARRRRADARQGAAVARKRAPHA